MLRFSAKCAAAWLALCAALWVGSETLARSETQVEMLLLVSKKSCQVPSFGGALVAHWTADSGITQSSNQVSQWTDTVAGINLAQATTANKPQYLAAGYNGKPAIGLFGSVGSGGFSQTWMTTSGHPVTLGTTIFSVFIAGQLGTNTDATGFGRFVSFLGNGSTADNAAGSTVPLLRSGTAAQINSSVSTSAALATENVSLNANHRIGMIYDSANMTSYLDGQVGTVTASTTGFTAAGDVGIGGNLPTPTVWIDGIEREIFMYNSVLNTAQIATLDNYLTCNNGP